MGTTRKETLYPSIFFHEDLGSEGAAVLFGPWGEPMASKCPQGTPTAGPRAGENVVSILHCLSSGSGVPDFVFLAQAISS